MRWIIVDGNNLIHSDTRHLLGKQVNDFNTLRWSLSRAIDELAGELADRVTIVFDGSAGGADEAFKTPFIQVLFSQPDSTADNVIERLVSESTEPAEIVVVTSDSGERMTVGAAGASTMTCRHFLELLVEARQSLARRVRSNPHSLPRPKLGDIFP